MIKKLLMDSDSQKTKQSQVSAMVESSSKNTSKNQDTLNINSLEMNMETMFIYLKENARFKEGTKKLLKKPHAVLWMMLLVKRWENKLLP